MTPRRPHLCQIPPVDRKAGLGLHRPGQQLFGLLRSPRLMANQAQKMQRLRTSRLAGQDVTVQTFGRRQIARLVEGKRPGKLRIR
jgi:hypothetical protein